MKIHVGYGIGAIGYMVGVFLLTGSREAAGSPGPGGSVVENLVNISLFAGLSCCLLLSVNDGRWYRRVPWQLYAMIVLIAGTYAVVAGWHQSPVADRYATSGDVVLRLLTIATLVVVHRFAGGQRPGS
jgi:hypothetical protein